MGREIRTRPDTYKVSLEVQVRLFDLEAVGGIQGGLVETETKTKTSANSVRIAREYFILPRVQLPPTEIKQSTCFGPSIMLRHKCWRLT